MLDLLLFVLTAWAATAAGRAVLHLLHLDDGPTRLERNLFGLGLGLGMLAYGMLAAGLLGGLYRPVGIGLLLLLFAVGVRQHGGMALELRNTFRGGVRLPAWGWSIVILFLLLALIPLVGVWTPPTAGLEWDSLSYHLADPKLYLQAHRIYNIPWESHSNFAFTAEMWYLFGLMERGTEAGVPLAKLFHFTCGVGACLAVYAFGARHLSPRVGLTAAVIFASTPLVLWEAGTAYADLAGAFFAVVTLLAVVRGMAERDRRWLWLGAILMGLTLSTKATALSTLTLLALALLFWRVRGQGQEWPRALGSAAVWCLLAIAVGSPWYIKSTVYTGNPIYPFYYQIFGGRGFSAALAQAYDQSNANFGVTYEKQGADPKLVRSPDMAALVPWNLTMYLLPGHPPPNPVFRPFNDGSGQFPLAALSPLLLAALFFPTFLRGVPGIVRALALYALCSVGLWLLTSQQVRYLLPVLPVLCLLAGWVLVRAWEGRWRSGYALAGLGLCSLGFTFYLGMGLLRVEAPVALGWQPRARYLERDPSGYPAMQFINRNLPAGTKVVFYGNPFGFYCDKPYLWGDANHSTYIPYDTFHTADDLRTYLAKIGVTHFLLNQHNLPGPDAPGYTRWVYTLAERSGPPVFEAHGVEVYALPEARQ